MISDVARFRAGRAFTSAGGAATEVLAPLILVSTLGGTPAHVAVLLAVMLATSMLLRIPLAVWADRSRRHVRLMILTATLSGLWSTVAPIMWSVGALSPVTLIAWLAVNILLLTALSVLGHGVLNHLTEPEDRVRQVGLLSSATSTGEIVGQSGAPLLIAFMPAPLALLIDTVASWIAALSWTRIPDVDADPAEEPRPSLRLIARQLSRNPTLWIAAAAGLFSSLTAPLGVYYFVNTLGVDPPLLGLVVATGALGGITGGVALGRLYARWSTATVVVIGLLAMGLATIGVALAPANSPWTYVALVAIEFSTAFGGTLVMATLYGELQSGAGSHDVARTMSSASFLVEATGLAGLGAGALLAAWLPIPAAYAIAGALTVMLVIPAATGQRRVSREDAPRSSR
ncbi:MULTISPECIES: MFS transporter [Microbacterium]|uniref:MFS transporter n=1 Tax=Microbacterium TaxID=33882 RepID=UPI0012FEEDCA|nr:MULTISPECIES: MFS transporter [Microbacterium]